MLKRPIQPTPSMNYSTRLYYLFVRHFSGSHNVTTCKCIDLELNYHSQYCITHAVVKLFFRQCEQQLHICSNILLHYSYITACCVTMQRAIIINFISSTTLYPPVKKRSFEYTYVRITMSQCLCCNGICMILGFYCEQGACYV